MSFKKERLLQTMEKNENGFSALFPGNYGEGCTSKQLAMVYSPFQCWRMLYSPDVALMKGTLFEELDKPLEDVK